MKLRRSSLQVIISTVSILAVLNATPVHAGPAEDYAEATRLRYIVGDLMAAIPLFRKAADAGHPGAQASIGEILDHADSDEEAIAYFRKSAAQNNADGQFGLGAMLSVGEGAPKDLSEARRLIQLAAGQGHKLAINELAHAYISGGLELTEEARQSPEALRVIRLAAENGYLTAMDKLVTAYRSGELGLAIDAKVADQWAEKIRKIRGNPKGRRAKKE